MWLTLAIDAPDDYVIATGELHSVRDFVDAAFKATGITLKWSGEGTGTVGTDASTGRELVGVDPEFYRPSEVSGAAGNASRAKAVLGWRPRTSFDELVRIMVEHDIEDMRTRGKQ